MLNGYMSFDNIRSINKTLMKKIHDSRVNFPNTIIRNKQPDGKKGSN